MRGPTYPLQNGADGRIQESSDLGTLSKSWVRQYLMTTRGSRPMRPTWGAGAEALMHEPNGTAARILLRKRIADMQGQLPVVLDDVTFAPSRSGLAEDVEPVVRFHPVQDRAAEQTVKLAEE